MFTDATRHCSESVLNPVYAELKKLSSFFITQISNPKLAFWFFTGPPSVQLYALSCGHNSGESMKNITALELPFFEDCTVYFHFRQLACGRYRSQGVPKPLRRAPSRNSLPARKHRLDSFLEYFFILHVVYTLSFLYLVCTSLPSHPGLSISHPPLHYLPLL